jgi:Uma2 family endonuclease
MSTVASTQTPESLTSHALPPPTSSAPSNLPGGELSSALYRLTVRQFDRMVHDGIIREAERVELVEGLLVTKMSRNRPHVQAGVRGLRLLSGLVPASWHVRKEDPIVASDWSKPEPDLAVVRGRDEDYHERDVTSADVALVVEIAESSLPVDRQDMARVYSTASIAIYWIINLVELQVEVYSDPGSSGYGSTQILKPAETVPVVIDGVSVGQIAVSELLPPRERRTSGGES